MSKSLPFQSPAPRPDRAIGIIRRPPSWSRRSAYWQDDQAPTGEEAQAERQTTAMPLLWIGLGVLLVLACIVFARWGVDSVITPGGPFAAPLGARTVANPTGPALLERR